MLQSPMCYLICPDMYLIQFGLYFRHTTESFHNNRDRPGSRKFLAVNFKKRETVKAESHRANTASAAILFFHHYLDNLYKR